MEQLDFEEAISIVEEASDKERIHKMAPSRLFKLHEAQAMLAAEYVKVRLRIMPT